jgi:hypothetical protein
MRAMHRPRLPGIVMTLILSCAVLVAGWSHGMASGHDDPAGAAIEAYVQAGGSLTDLCGTRDGGHSDQATCMVCCLVHAAVLIVPDHSSAPVPRLAEAVMLREGQREQVAQHHPAWHGRAPPTF